MNVFHINYKSYIKLFTYIFMNLIDVFRELIVIVEFDIVKLLYVSRWIDDAMQCYNYLVDLYIFLQNETSRKVGIRWLYFFLAICLLKDTQSNICETRAKQMIVCMFLLKESVRIG